MRTRRRDLDPATVLIHAKDHKIGDGYLQAAFFQAARARFPHAHITLAVSLGRSAYSASLAAVVEPYIDEIVEEAHLCEQWRQILRWRAPLAGRHFDLVIDLQKNWWRTLAIRRIRHAVFISASNHYLFSDRRPPPPMKPPRLIDQLIKLLDAACRDPRAVPVPLTWCGPAERAAAARALPDGAPTIGLVPGAGEVFKRWPLERYIAVARDQAAKGRRAVFVLGPQEVEWIDRISSAVPESLLPGWTGSNSGKSGLRPLEVTALAERLTAVVTNDCGAAHMLAAGQVPMIALFGATNPDKYLPATPILRVIRAAATGPQAINSITVDAVVNALERLLDVIGLSSPRPAPGTPTFRHPPAPA